MALLKLFKQVAFWLAPLALMGATVFSAQLLFTRVDLKPKVEPHFFFADDDPQFRRDLEIRKIFPEPEQIILAVKGPIRSEDYQDKIGALSRDLLALLPFFVVQSLSHGPEDVEAVFESPLWKRLLLSKDGTSTMLLLYAHKIPPAEIYQEIENIVKGYEAPDFQIVISGAPYVVDLIRRYLFRDLQVFSLAAFAVFTIIMLAIFRSVRILLGTIVACTNASIATLFAAQSLDIGIGPLTANLSTIVFVLTLSHIAYMTFNWKHSLENPTPRHGRDQCVRLRCRPHSP